MAKDEINSPDHYTAGGIEVFKIIKAKLTPEQYVGYLLGTKLAYLLRANFKGQFEKDILKDGWYSKEFENALLEQKGIITGLGITKETNFTEEVQKAREILFAPTSESETLGTVLEDDDVKSFLSADGWERRYLRPNVELQFPALYLSPVYRETILEPRWAAPENADDRKVRVSGQGKIISGW